MGIPKWGSPNGDPQMGIPKLGIPRWGPQMGIPNWGSPNGVPKWGPQMEATKGTYGVTLVVLVGSETVPRERQWVPLGPQGSTDGPNQPPVDPQGACMVTSRWALITFTECA